MSTDGDVLHPVSARSRSTRSHSLKQQSLPMALFKQRSKRTMSLPSKPVLLPMINIQRCHDNWDDESDEDEDEDEDEKEEDMGTIILAVKMYMILSLVKISSQTNRRGVDAVKDLHNFREFSKPPNV